MDGLLVTDQGRRGERAKEGEGKRLKWRRGKGREG